MSNELEAGCLARIINSVNGTDGATVNKIVQLLNMNGMHSVYGVIWTVHSKDTLVSEHGGVGNTVDVPAIWLKKIQPGELDKNLTKTLELAS